MRTADEIRDRIRGLLVEELDRRVREASERLPHLCVHNHRQPLDIRKTVEGSPNDMYNRITRDGKRSLPVVSTMGLCMLGSEDPTTWEGSICEDPIDAQRCPVFTPRRSKDDIWDEFFAQVSDLEWLCEHMPQVHALYWVLSAEVANVAVPWWRRLWFRLARIRLAEPLPPFDPSKLLPPPLE